MSRWGALWPLLILSHLMAVRTARAAVPNKFECVAEDDAAQELRRAGKLHEARERLRVCSSASCPALVRQDCTQRLSEVDAAMPSVVFEVRNAANDALVAVTVTMDGQRLTDRLDGVPVEVDPGEHRLIFESEGLPRAEQTIDVREGEHERHETIVLGSRAARVTRASSPFEITSRRTVAFAVGGVGVVGLVVGGVLGLVAKTTYDHALVAECGSNWNGGCSPQGIADGRSAHSQAAASTGAFVAGGLLLGAGTLVFLTEPRANVIVGATASSIVMSRAW